MHEKMSNTFEFILLFYHRFGYNCICTFGEWKCRCKKKQIFSVPLLSVWYRCRFWFISGCIQPFNRLSFQLAVGSWQLAMPNIRPSSYVAQVKENEEKDAREVHKIKWFSILRMTNESTSQFSWNRFFCCT